MAKEKIVSIIDVGSSKITTLIAEVAEEEQIQIIGVSSIPSRGIKKGVVVDIDRAVETLAESLEAAERMAGFAVSRAYITVNGNHISSVNSQGVVAVSSAEGEIAPADVDRVIEAARAISMPSSREIIHVVPRTFIVDAQEGIHDPIGMSGIRLQVETHIISGAATSMRNLVRCVQQVGVDVENLVFAGLASSSAVLNETEKELGVVLVDVGGGTTDVNVFVEGSPTYSSVLPLGGKNITNDIAIGLRVSLDEAKKIKHFASRESRQPAEPAGRKSLPDRQAGKTRISKSKTEDEEIDLSDLGIKDLKKVERKFLVNGIIEPRLEEIAEEVYDELRKSGAEELIPAGVVLCGGAAQTVGAEEVFKDVLRVPVRVAKPEGVSGLIEEIDSPAYAGSVGAVIYAAHTDEGGGVGLGMPSLGGFSLDRIGDTIKEGVDWIKSFNPYGK